MMRSVAIVALAASLAAVSCTSRRAPAAGAPTPASFPRLDVPASLAVAPGVRQRHEQAALQLQAGDLRGSSRGFSDVLKAAPDFYPAETGLGYVALAHRQYRQATARFAAALRQSPKYLPALEGQVQVRLGEADDVGAVLAIEQLLAVDPRREEMRNRLDVLRLRVVQGQLETAAKARAAGRLEEAQRVLERAVESSPSSGVLTRELARVELARGQAESAEAHARKAIELDAQDAESWTLLGDTLDTSGRTREAADAYAKAVAIDPQPAWIAKREALTERANLEALPPEYRAIGSAPTVTRGQVAAMVGIELDALIDRAPKRAGDVITDLRGHWAASWILPVSQAGIMTVLPNHTFQPNATVRRGELAQVVSRLLTLIGNRRPSDLAAWRAARPPFADVAPGHVSYRSIANATAAGAMAVDDQSRFSPSQPASGADLTAAIARLRQLAGR